MIKDIKAEDMLGDIQRGDHFIFGMNNKGIHPEDIYGFTHRVVENYCHNFKDVGEHEVGTIITHEVPELHCTFHGIVTHDVEKGWYHDPEGPSVYVAIRDALDSLEEKYDDELVRDMKSLWLGRGHQRLIGESKSNTRWTMQAMAQSKLPVVVYVQDGYEEW